MPRFPINGHALKDRGCPGKKTIGLVLYQLKLIWADSDFKLTADELLDKHLPTVLENLDTESMSPNKKQKTTK